MITHTQYRKGCIRTLVLQLLSEKAMYGYQIAKDLAERSEGFFNLSLGTVYPLLYELEKKGLIVISGQQTYGRVGRRRIYYSATMEGRKALVAEKEIWRQTAEAMRRVMNPPNPQ